VTFECNQCHHKVEFHKSAHSPADEESVPAPQKIHFGLTLKVMIIMIIISLVPFAISWGVFFNKTGNQTRSDTERLMEQTADGLMIHVDEWLDKNIRLLNTIAQLPEIVSMNRAQQEPVLRLIQANYPYMYLVLITNSAGMNTARSDNAALQSYADREYFKKIAQGNDLAWENIIGRTSKKPSVVFSVPIKSDGKFVGVLAAAMTIEQVSANIAKWKKGKTGFAFLVDNNMKVVAHQTKQYETEQKDLSGHPLIQAFKQGKNTATIHFSNENGQRSLGFSKGNKLGWVLAIQQDYSEVFETLREVQFFSLILLLITVILISSVAYLSARSIIKPIRSLTHATERMSLGDIDIKIDVASKDEIGLLAQAIKRMQMSLKIGLNRSRRK